MPRLAAVIRQRVHSTDTLNPMRTFRWRETGNLDSGRRRTLQKKYFRMPSHTHLTLPAMGPHESTRPLRAASRKAKA